MNANLIKDEVLPTYPLISVIVPVYNVEEYLSRCIESILNQNYRDLELILVDDGSTDNSVELANHYIKKDSRVKLFRQSNQGSSIARNTGLSYAQGEYISFVDSDDWILPQMLGTMLNIAIENNLEVVECESVRSTDYKKLDTLKPQSNTRHRIETKEESLARVIKNQNFAVWRRIYHKSIIENLKFIPHKIHQDVFFTIDILKKIKQQGYIKTPLYIYNVENTSIIRSPYNQKKLDAIDAVFYVINQTENFNDKVKINAKKHVIQVLRYHYHELFTHDYLDPEYKVRKSIRKEISKNLSSKSWSMYGTLINLLPFKMYRIFLWLNKYRISAQVYLLKLLR